MANSASSAARVAGIDEAGRGPLAGPVVAAAVVLPLALPPALAGLLDDSKKLSPARREAAFAALQTARVAGLVEIGVGAASVAEIARINILQASLLAMRRAVGRLPALPDLALVDGNQSPGLACPARCIVGGDATEAAISAASIVAKVLRDRAMARLAGRHPGYGWEANAGYGTELHRAALRRLGATPHHRAGFGTVRRIALDLASGGAQPAIAD
ncbi:ribonuclease HII [Limobrevibacterium gyesilva]|uniref:Ribonuclease HII n=1 Tax=Limobrevibacterium gyesilva TaxID=2991712 RepID=A0AA42CFT3_9PROT|nr:ribonuclease HII [Limobrevibacterium gyesilva]MCW3477004.1 ribonuclease HII [Limobrevibacterium gyesilva]